MELWQRQTYALLRFGILLTAADGLAPKMIAGAEVTKL